ncbi:protein-L-isoaspartate(D-aspartate) O-methyltransferase [Ideonella sp. YS5]|uniref:protein-L-isoaspartate(D-aspartate) O-methyltransferase n=1 Tax=Ideonella sp. YS5 TaxID=3453714 RepID=UPI003EEF0995
MADDDDYAQSRAGMLAEITALVIFNTGRLGKAALDRRVLDALSEVPRHEFVPSELRLCAYADSPLPIGCGKTISQPFIVAVMTDLLGPQAADRVLEIGTGMGYQTAILSRLVRHVYTVELIELLALAARQRLSRLGCRNVTQRVANGHQGWPEQAPFDKILVSAAPQEVPPALIEQLAPGGRLVLPAGPPEHQVLLVLDKAADGTLKRREVFGVRFSLLEDSAPR